MGEIYDIFERCAAGAVWVESFVGLPGIAERVAHLNAARPGDYFAYSVHDAKVVAELSPSPYLELRAVTHAHSPVAPHSRHGEHGGANGNGVNGQGANGRNAKGNGANRHGTNGNGTNGNGAARLPPGGNHEQDYEPDGEPDTKTATSSD
jgi:hypothetical protein